MSALEMAILFQVVLFAVYVIRSRGEIELSGRERCWVGSQMSTRSRSLWPRPQTDRSCRRGGEGHCDRHIVQHRFEAAVGGIPRRI